MGRYNLRAVCPRRRTRCMVMILKSKIQWRNWGYVCRKTTREGCKYSSTQVWLNQVSWLCVRSSGLEYILSHSYNIPFSMEYGYIRIEFKTNELGPSELTLWICCPKNTSCQSHRLEDCVHVHSAYHGLHRRPWSESIHPKFHFVHILRGKGVDTPHTERRIPLIMNSTMYCMQISVWVTPLVHTCHNFSGAKFLDE